MATTDKEERRGNRERIALFVLLGLLALGGLAVLYGYLGRPPQMGRDEEVFKTVDALFTAVTARDEQQLAQCERRLQGFKESGALPVKAWKHLEGVIAKARAGRWRASAETLYEFMFAQRREGAGVAGTPKRR